MSHDLQDPRSPAADPTPAPTFFAAVGGAPTFHRLVRAFYAGVAEDPLLRPMYPEGDLEPAARRLEMFLVQYWGGPNDYSRERGHPRLRIRHAPFAIDAAARDRWLHHMRRAVDTLVADGTLSPTQAAELGDYCTRAAEAMVNTPPPAGAVGRPLPFLGAPTNAFTESTADARR